MPHLEGGTWSPDPDKEVNGRGLGPHGVRVVWKRDPQGTLSGAMTEGGEWCWYLAQPRLQAQLEHLLAMCTITFPCLSFPTVQVGAMLAPVTGCCEALGGMGWALPLALGGCL